MSNAIQLVVGLANPGSDYAETRHNAGAWLVEQLAEQSLRPEPKFHGRAGLIHVEGHNCRLLIPTTYMNRSGQAIKAMADFYRIEPHAILVVHDELDLPVGTARFKQGGGDGGHNGLRDTSAHLQTNDYWRLRIGIGHPGHRDRVHDYVLSRPSKMDREHIISAITAAIAVLLRFILGEQQKAIQQLHTND